MKNARKPKHILDMEKGTPSPLQEILMPKAIEERSETTLALKGETLSECMPELTLIARDEGLNLNKREDFLKAKRIMFMDRLNKR